MNITLVSIDYKSPNSSRMITRLALILSTCMVVVTPLVSQQALADYTFDQSELTVCLVDIDNDDDMDAFIGAKSKIYFFENDGTGMYSDMTEVYEMQLPDVNWVDLSMDFTDIDGDGDYDLSIMGNVSFQRELYMNDGTMQSPSFKKKEDSALDVMDFTALDGSFAAGYTDAYHSWADLDNDGDKDCIVGGKLGWFLYYENVGNAQELVLQERSGQDNPLNEYRVQGGDEGTGMQYESSPYLIDIDVDGDYDLFSGNQMGSYHYYENVGTALEPIFEERTGRDNPLSELHVAEDSKVAITDQDCDGIWEAYYSGEGQNSIQVEELNKYVVKPIKVVVEDDVIDMNEGSMNLTGGFPAGGVWSGTGVSDGVFDPSLVGEGFHRITYTVDTDYGCTLSTSEIITVEGGTAIEYTELPRGVHVQPKYNMISIRNSENVTLNVSLIDQLGNKVISQEVNDSQDLFFEVYTAGVYVINIRTESTNYSERMFLSN